MAEEIAVLAGGCFWCTEAVFLDVVGVKSVESGYTGGHGRQSDLQAGLRRRHRPCRSDPHHLRSRALSYDDLLDIFFATHDPTQLNRQGNDIGTQYRSAIFPQNEEQERKAREAIERANVTHHGGRMVTTIEPMGEWWPAEDYHQDYWAGEGQRNPYCLATIPPKLQKLRKSFQARANRQQRPPSERSLRLRRHAAGGGRCFSHRAWPNRGGAALALFLLAVRVAEAVVDRAEASSVARRDPRLGEASAWWSRSNSRAAASTRSPDGLRLTSPSISPEADQIFAGFGGRGVQPQRL